jgi:monofunctional glycosyltransferase
LQQPSLRRRGWRVVRKLLLQLVLTWLILTAVPVLILRWVNPPLTMFMVLDRWDAALSDEPGYRFAWSWVDLTDMAAHVPVAVIAAEDQRFASHYGFDLVEIGQALSARNRGTSRRGASTLTQQTAKNLFLWGGHSWVRKGIEAWFTILLESLWPKTRILEVYVNVAEFGQGVFGAGAASERFFDKPAARLTINEAAMLAAVLPSPVRLRVDGPSANVYKRQQWIIRQMRSIGGTAYLQRLD